MITAYASLQRLEDGRLVHEQLNKVVANLMSLWGVAWLTCMQNVGAPRMLREVQQDAVSKCGHLECHGPIWTSEMPARAEGTGTILTNATGGCVTRLCYFCGCAECMCQHGCA